MLCCVVSGVKCKHFGLFAELMKFNRPYSRYPPFFARALGLKQYVRREVVETLIRALWYSCYAEGDWHHPLSSWR